MGGLFCALVMYRYFGRSINMRRTVVRALAFTIVFSEVNYSSSTPAIAMSMYFATIRVYNHTPLSTAPAPNSSAVGREASEI